MGDDQKSQADRLGETIRPLTEILTPLQADMLRAAFHIRCCICNQSLGTIDGDRIQQHFESHGAKLVLDVNRREAEQKREVP